MPKTFDDYISQKIPENKPKGHPASGSPSEILRAVAYDHVKGEKNKPHVNVTFNGLVVKTQKISVRDMHEKYDSSFMSYMGKLLRIIDDEENTAWDLTNVVTEAIVYIPEISACLPQPADAERFFKELSNFTKRPKPGEEEKMLKEQQKKISLTKREIKQLERYPLAYFVSTSQKSGDKVKLPTSQSIVTVQFPYSFDFSYGVITGVSS